MSLILEALRKSEAERRRGQVPGLHAERAPAALPARIARPAWPWIAVAIPAVLATAWLAGRPWSPPRATDGAANAAVGPPSPARPAISAPPRGPIVDGAFTGRGDAATMASDDDARTAPVTALATASADPAFRERAAAPLGRTLASPAAPAAATTAARAPAAAATPRADTSDPDAARNPPASAPAGVATAAPAPTIAPLPRQPTAPTPAVAAAMTPPVVPPAGAGATLRLADLSAAERLELPPLKISMHLWDPAPARRFAIIDGARVNEGDRIGNAVVAEITARAVVLTWHGRRLQLPLR